MEWMKDFDERELRLMTNCKEYADSDPAGLPGHKLMLIVAQLVDILNDKELGPISEYANNCCICDKCGQPHNPKLISNGTGYAA